MQMKCQWKGKECTLDLPQRENKEREKTFKWGANAIDVCFCICIIGAALVSDYTRWTRDFSWSLQIARVFCWCWCLNKLPFESKILRINRILHMILFKLCRWLIKISLTKQNSSVFFCNFIYLLILHKKKTNKKKTSGQVYLVSSRSIPLKCVGVTCDRPLPSTPTTQHALLYWLTLSDNLSCTYCVSPFQRWARSS